MKQIESFVEHCNDLIAIADSSGNLTYTNELWGELTGWSSVELSTNKLLGFIHPDDHKATLREIENLNQGSKVFKFVNRFKKKDGKYLYLAWNGKAKDGLIYSVARECHDEVLTQERIEIVNDVLEIGYFDFGLIENSVKWDKTLCQIFQVPFLEDKNYLTDWYRLLDAKDRNWLDKLDLSRYQTLNYSFRIVTDSGQEKYIRALAKIFKDSHGKPYRMLGIHFDITQEKRQKLAHAKRKEVVHRQAKLASLGELSASIGHEINNPLAILTGQNELIKKELDKDQPDLEIIRGFFERQAKTLDRIALITKELRSFTRMGESQSERVSLHTMLSSALDFSGHLLRTSGVEIECDVPETDVYIKGIEGRILQILFNLFSNAKDAMGDLVEKKILVYTYVDIKNVIIFVKDFGAGIDPKMQEKIFDAFYTSKPVGEGTGLGLSLSKTLAEEMQGQLRLHETSREGTVFALELPRIYEPDTHVIEHQKGALQRE